MTQLSDSAVNWTTKTYLLFWEYTQIREYAGSVDDLLQLSDRL